MQYCKSTHAAFFLNSIPSYLFWDNSQGPYIRWTSYCISTTKQKILLASLAVVINNNNSKHLIVLEKWNFFGGELL